MKRDFEGKNITGKRINLVISKDTYKALQAQRKDMKMTPFIEQLILNTDPNTLILTQNQNALLDKFNALINFNKKLFIDVNATFSNVNQIAYRLNIANLSEDEEELEILIQNKDFQTETKQILIDTKEEIQSLKSLIKTFISLLENSKQHTKNTQTQKGESQQ